MTTPTLVGVSLKMYFGHAQTLDWIAKVGDLARSHASVQDGSVEVFVIPGFVSLAASVSALDDTPVLVGAQDLATEDAGAFTGEVSGVELAEVGARVVEVGHAERRALFGETDEIVAKKTSAALRNGLAPVLCVGEKTRSTADDAVDECLRQLSSALADAPAGRVIVAYEPVWAIGAAEPAEPAYVRSVCARLREAVDGRPDSAVIYGGSAGPGLLAELGGDVDGIFLGRFAHNTDALARVLDEAGARR
jgi:triosephosphate isomerase